MGDKCIVDNKDESLQPPLKIIKNPTTGVAYKVCNDDMEIAEKKVYQAGLFPMSEAFHLMLWNEIKLAAGLP
jgi:hypothetical protein